MACKAKWAERRRSRLEEAIAQAEIRITEAEERIERHHQLWRVVDGAEQQAHVHLDYNLLQGLQLLHTHRAMLLHELREIQMPRRLVALGPSQEDEAEQADAARYAHLKQVTSWLDAVSTPALCRTTAEQRRRAAYEMWQIQKRQLRRRARLFS